MLLKKPTVQLRNLRGNQKIPQDKWKWKHNFPKSIGCKNNSKREVYHNTGLPQEKKSQTT